VKTGRPVNPGSYPLLILGLLGGVASGKSLVADQLKSLGAGILDGDQAGHEVLQQTEVKQEIFKRWGAEVFEPDPKTQTCEVNAGTETFPTESQVNQASRVNRAALARIVFQPSAAGREALEQLEQITHPRIKLLLERQLSSFRAEGYSLAVLDAPVMIKAGWHKLCNVIMFVDAPHAARLARAKRRGWEEGEFERREAAQESLEYKRSLADVIIDNSGTPEATAIQVNSWWNSQFPPAL